jgi:DivIVA domain-containing protein
MALLTADDIRFRKFTPVRFREGYDPDEVDDFLEEVISTIEELTKIARQNSTNTGTFQQVRTSGPSITDIENSPIVKGLRSENNTLKAKVSQLEAQPKPQVNISAPNPTGIDPQQLFSDNQEMAKRIQSSEQEISSLKQQLQTAQNIAQASANNGESVAQLESANAKINSLNAELDSMRSKYSAANNQVQQLQSKLQAAAVPADATGSLLAISGAASQATNTGTSQASAMLEMAQKLHDEYVNKGRQEAASMVDNAKSESEKITSEAKIKSDLLVSEAESKAREAKEKADQTFRVLNDEKHAIEGKIKELVDYEKQLRVRISDFLESMLRDVKSRTE